MNSNADTVADDGVMTLREAVVAANADPAPDVITFDSTVFTGSDTILLDSPLPVSSALGIWGPGESELSLNGQGSTRLLSISGAAGPPVPVSLTCLTLENGFVNGDGGGIFNVESLTLQSVTMSGNSASGAGGALYSELGSVTMIDTTISGNTAVDAGAGIVALTPGLLRVESSVISGNSLTGTNVEGVGMKVELYDGSASLEVLDTTFDNNDAAVTNGDGGGLHVSGDAGSVATISGSTFTNNDLGTASPSSGGGIYVHNVDSVTITETTISSNSARFGGGIGAYVYDGDETIEIVGSTISGNTTTNAGAGLFVYAYDASSVPALSVVSSTISGNTGGGRAAGVYVYCYNGDGAGFSISHTTVTGNTAGDYGGLYVGGCSASITHSVVAGNADSAGPSDLRVITSFTPTYSLIGENAGSGLTEAQSADVNGNLVGSVGGSGIINPLLGALLDNGGPTLTHLPQVGSPVIDAGNPTLNPVPISDQRGLSRLEDGDGAGGDVIDLGAVEVQP